MSPDDPRHGSYAGAIKHWKDDEELCDPCAFAARRKRKKNQLDRLQGRPATTVLGDAHRVILAMPRNQLVAATGIQHRRMKELADGGPEKRVHRATRDRILAAETPTWTPVGIQRRIQALTALGWSLCVLADRSGVSASALGNLRRRKELKHVRLHFAGVVLDLYDELSMQLPPSGISAMETRNEAARRGYLPPLAWDDESIDDPDAHLQGRESAIDYDDFYRRAHQIDEVVIERILAGDGADLRSTVAEKREVVRRWKGSRNDLARLTGWKVERYTDQGVGDAGDGTDLNREDGAA